MSLRDRMKTDWKEMTVQEKKAAYYIAFGPHGPRRPPPPDEGRKVFLLSAGVIAASFAVFGLTRMFASPIRPHYDKGVARGDRRVPQGTRKRTDHRF